MTDRNRYVQREHYMEKIRQARDTSFIKIITGIRRCGKSTLMQMFMDELRESGVPDDRIFYINLDDEFSGIGSYHDLMEKVEASVGDLKGSYLFFDEIQNIPEWERAVSTFYIHESDVYVTGSNSDMLSSELSTKLSGRCLQIRVQPLAFSEYVEFREGKDIDGLLDDYLRWGGFPGVARLMDSSPRMVSESLDGIFSTVVLKDVVARHHIRDYPTVNHVIQFLMKNIGDRTSVRSMANYMTSSGMKTSPYTLDQYISYLEEALIFARSARIDSKSKEYLRTTDKFYMADLGLRGISIPYGIDDIDGIIENVVFNELMYRHGNVAVCGVGKYEVDFVADPAVSPSYYQVSMSIADKSTRERELRPLMMLEDNYPKTVITYERFPMDDIDGVRVVQLKDWLLESARPSKDDA